MEDFYKEYALLAPHGLLKEKCLGCLSQQGYRAIATGEETLLRYQGEGYERRCYAKLAVEGGSLVRVSFWTEAEAEVESGKAQAALEALLAMLQQIDKDRIEIAPPAVEVNHKAETVEMPKVMEEVFSHSEETTPQEKLAQPKAELPKKPEKRKIFCQHCGVALLVQETSNRLRVHCPQCDTVFFFDP